MPQASREPHTGYQTRRRPKTNTKNTHNYQLPTFSPTASKSDQAATDLEAGWMETSRRAVTTHIGCQGAFRRCRYQPPI